VTDDLAPSTSTEPRPWQLRALQALVLLEALLMAVFMVSELAFALAHTQANWGAVGFVVTAFSLWSAGLVLVAWGIGRGRRWAFTPIVLTQVMFGVIAITVVGSATPVAKAVWLFVLAVAVTAVVLAFSRPVREVVITR